LKRPLAALEVVFHIVRLLGAIVGIVLGTAFMKRRSVRTFYRTLRRVGLTQDEADLLTERYDLGIGVCEMLRALKIRHA